MAVIYRAVKANDSNDVIAIGYDNNQGGKDYNGIGVWCDFIFENFPTLPEDVLDYINENENLCNAYKIIDNTIVAKSLSELTK